MKTCELCLYETKDNSNYIKHLKSKKHLRKVNDSTKLEKSTSRNSPKLPKTPQNSSKLPKTTQIYNDFDDFTENSYLQSKNNSNILREYKCISCGNVFTRISNMTRHYKICSIKNNETLMLKLKLEQYEKDVNYHIKEAEYYKQLLREAGGLVKKSVSALTFAVDNYDNAPAIRTISVQEIDTFDSTDNANNDKKVVEDILSSYKHKTLGAYLGNFIIKIYKKDDPKNQSIWNTDDNRLTYLIKELMNNESSNWIVDKKGIKTKTYLIEPLLSHIKDLLVAYQSNNTPRIGMSNIETEFILENSKKIVELTNDIDDGIIGKDILKHISSHLRFSNKLIE